MSSPMDGSVADAKLRTAMQSGSIFKEAIESTTDSIIITSVELEHPGPQIEYVNKAFCTMTGYTPEEVIGQTPRILQGPLTDPNLRIRLREGLLRDEAFTGETVNYRKDGSCYNVEWRISPIRDGNGKVHKWVAIQRDITELKRNETRLREVDANKDEFLATLAHELRNPLAPLQASLNLLQHDVPPQRLKEAREVLARLKSGKIELQRTICNLTHSIQSAIEISRPLIEAKGQQLDVELGHAEVMLDADSSRLTQLVSNLLNNAAKYTNNGGTITLKVNATSSDVAIVVRDTGCGISREMLGQIFELYSQVERSRESSQGGLGIGLSLVKKLTELHNGTVTADSPGLGHGSTFTLHLPIAKPKEPSLMPRLAAGVDGVPHIHYARRILIIDDNQDGADTLSMLLELQGHDTRVAYNGPDGIKVAREFRPDVIFSDIQLPGFDGCELALRIRDEFGDTVILAAMTGRGSDEARERSREAGFNYHFVKPIRAEQLESVFGLRHSVFDKDAPLRFPAKGSTM